MALLVVLFFLFFPVAVIFYELERRKKIAKFPPGPFSLPFLGNILEFVGKNRPKHEIIAKLSEKYGDLMTLWFLNKPVVILSSPEAVRQAYIDRNDFSDRPESLVAVLLFDGNDRDIAFGHYTPKWQAKRKLFHQSIRTLVGTPRLEREAIAVVDQVVSKMLQQGPGAAIDMQSYVIKAVYNMVIILAFGKRFDLDDPEFLRFCQTHNIDTEAINVSRFYDTFPIFQYLPIFQISPTLKKMKELVRGYRGYIMRWYYEAKEIISDETESMTQALVKGLSIADAKANANENGETNGEYRKVYGDDEIMHMLVDLYIGSTSTTSSAISWLILEMIIHPEIQEKCYNELMQVTEGRQVTLSDRHKLPYVEACIAETLRHHSPVSLSVPHSPVSDAQLRDYNLPAGTETILNIWALHHDPKLWKDAKNFNPENFLDESGRFDRPPHMFTFGAGRRSCPGEMFAKNNIFLTFTVMLQQLRFERVPGCEYNPYLSEISGEFLTWPKPYKVAVVEREK